MLAVIIIRHLVVLNKSIADRVAGLQCEVSYHMPKYIGKSIEGVDVAGWVKNVFACM